MESLESKIDRLSPEQRSEIEDFVDFLLSRSGQAPAPQVPSRMADPARNEAPPPLTLIEPVHILESEPYRQQSPGCERDTGQTGEGPVAPPMLQDGSGGPGDNISSDYMDYGQFERRSSLPSPATEAVRNVKARLAKSDEHDRSKHLLDWID